MCVVFSVRSLHIEVGNKKKSFYINYGIMLPAAQYSVIRKWLLSFNSGNKVKKGKNNVSVKYFPH